MRGRQDIGVSHIARFLVRAPRTVTMVRMHSERLSVTDLLQRARGNDPREVDRLFGACRNYLNVLARAQVESWLRAKVDASDLVQQTLLEAYRDFQRFRGTTEAEWLAWLRQILTHNAA